MKKIIIAGAVLATALILTGCGHNAIQYGDGVGFDAGINPENYTLSLNLRYGKILSAVTRDNVEIEVAGKTETNGATGTEKTGSTGMATDGSLKVKIGRQINGAAVDLVKAGANPEKVIEALTRKEETPAQTGTAANTGTTVQTGMTVKTENVETKATETK